MSIGLTKIHHSVSPVKQVIRLFLNLLEFVRLAMQVAASEQHTLFPQDSFKVILKQSDWSFWKSLPVSYFLLPYTYFLLTNKLFWVQMFFFSQRNQLSLFPLSSVVSGKFLMSTFPVTHIVAHRSISIMQFEY